MGKNKYLYQLYDLAFGKGVIVEQTIGQDEFVFVQPRTGKRLSPWIQGLDKAIEWIESYQPEGVDHGSGSHTSA